MLNTIPAELLLRILSFVHSENSGGDLSSLSQTNHYMSVTTRDYRAQLLRSRLQAISHVEILMRIWTPPLFFRRRGGSGQSSGGLISGYKDLHDILCDPNVYGMIDRYLATLERNNWVAARIADYIITMVDFNHLRTTAEKKIYAQSCVIELWSFHLRYGHDIDGYIMGLREDYGPDYYLQDQYVRSLPSTMSAGLIKVYHVLSQYLRPPFYPSPNRVEGLWLYRYILRDGMECVLSMLEGKPR